MIAIVIKYGSIVIPSAYADSAYALGIAGLHTRFRRLQTRSRNNLRRERKLRQKRERERDADVT